MITLKNIIKKYDNDVILNINELVIKNNERVGIMGVNGSGKTTLVEIIMGTRKPDQGQLIFDEDIKDKNAVFQECNFELDLNLNTIANFYRKLFKSNENLDRLYEKFELIDFKKKKYNKLSGGQKQKFKLLIAFINNPKLLLLDELTTALDYEWRTKIIQEVAEYSNLRNPIILFVSHDISEISKICNRVIFLKKGLIINDIELTENYSTNLSLLEKELKNVTNN
ncbi:ATP-binding cassette domain-containing protein [Spiroplasma turonicum]|uniref:ABC transporter ATP-binding protein n=1 Tax=Spiroplasma turonicum TaxID=216946 RepID=A0A0K1P7B4_9MOLU|nr:ABC transporter ATP-binding protein [Spiroplasma turonicum]AKU80178.1 ABC transporter ATP-binding protein [Spiroplasma turonicum]ALX71178.1 ABC transporter ATP-binding protein [Spiroplasma turonicum]